MTKDLLNRLQEADSPFKSATPEELEKRRNPPGQKKFLVRFSYDVGGTCTIMAMDEKDAHTKVFDILADEGIEGLTDVDYGAREYDSYDAEELPK